MPVARRLLPARRPRQPPLQTAGPRQKRHSQAKLTPPNPVGTIRRRAEALLATADRAQLLKLVPAVAETVQRQFRAEDCHFGAALPFFEQALKHQQNRQRRLARDAADDAHRKRTSAALADERTRRRQVRARRLAAWKGLSRSSKLRYYDRAITAAPSAAARARLRRNRDLDNPPTDVLALLAANTAGTRGE